MELLVYLVLAAAFLSLYVAHYQEPLAVAPRHLALLTTALILFWGVRALAWRYLGERSARAVAVILMTLPPLALLAWYAVVLIGLDAWGRVPTWPLIKTYLVQAPALLDVLGITPWALMAGVLLAVLALVYLVWRYLAARDWARGLARLGSATGGGVIIAGVMGLAILLLHVQTQSWVGHPREPILLGFFHETTGLQSHRVQGSRLADANEAAARQQYRPNPARPTRNLVVIVGDALRADHMAVYGYGRPTTPELAKRVRTFDSAVVRRVRSACAESSCGLMAMAASRPVADIGTAPITLQEVLKLHGYLIHFILGGDHTNFYGLKEMYGAVDSFHDGSGQGVRYINDDQLVLDRVRALPPAKSGQAVAFQFHLMSTHGLGQRDPSLSPFVPAENYYGWPGPSPRRPPSGDTARAGVNYYDNGMVRFDNMASRILDELKEKGYLDDALVVVTGDHGEMLGEQGMFAHQYGLSESVLDIPLLLLRHGYVGEPIPASPWSSQIDVAPTILRELGLAAPTTWEGRALQDTWIPRELRIQQSHHFGIYRIDGDGNVLKYVHDLDSGAESVTNPVADPLGAVDLSPHVAPEVMKGWRNQSMVGMLNAANPER